MDAVETIICVVLGILLSFLSILLFHLYFYKEKKFALVLAVFSSNLAFIFFSALFYVLFFEVRITVVFNG